MPFSKLGPLWRMFVGISSSCISRPPSILPLCFRFTLSLVTQLTSLGGCISSVGSGRGRILVNVRKVLQSRPVSLLQSRKPSWRGFVGGGFKGCIFKTIILPTNPLAIGLLRHLIFFATRSVWPCWRPQVVRWFVDALLRWWCVWFWARCIIWRVPYLWIVDRCRLW